VSHTNKLQTNFLDIHKIQQKGHTIEGDLDVNFNPVVSTILKFVNVQTSEVDAKLAPVRVGQ
jgi:hypothetical protein